MDWKSSSCTISYGVEEEEEGDPGRFGHSMHVVVCCLSIRPGCSVSQKAALGLESASRRDGWVPCHCASGNALVAIKDRTHLGEVDPVQLTNTKKIPLSFTIPEQWKDLPTRTTTRMLDSWQFAGDGWKTHLYHHDCILANKQTNKTTTNNRFAFSFFTSV